MELQIWEGDWGLPSVDHHCLAVLAYSKFVNANVEVKKLGNPWKSPSGELPVLSHSGGLEKKVQDILQFLKTQDMSANHSLASKERADTIAFASLMEDKLYPALLFSWWVDTKSYVEFTRPWYSKRLPLPLCWYLPMKIRDEAVKRIAVLNGKDPSSEDEQKAQLTKDAKECLNLLSAKLGDKQYFLGDRPTLIDALAFGYLGPLLNAPLPCMTLQNHLKACSNLVQFCQRILNAYFPLSPEEQERNRKMAEEARQKLAEDAEFPNRRRHVVIAVAVMVGAMLGYALVNGLIQLEFIDADQKPKNNKSTNVSHTSDVEDETENTD